MPNLTLHTLPISQRPPNRSWIRTAKAVLFCVLFNFGCLLVNASQFIFLLPLRILPFRWSTVWYQEGIRYTKGAFGCLLILMCQWFAPTKLSITFEMEGKGRFTAEEVERVVMRNQVGQVVSLNLPSKFVLIANHQIYADWWYAWCLMYFVNPQGVHRHVYITLKKSLKWVPIVGWGMQFYNFIFLARSWASDRIHLASHLSALGKQAEEEDTPLSFILYPEGTLVSKNTRPISKKYATKIGTSDMLNTLMPRSTGLHYSLRSLSPRIPNLRLLDVTVVYPGIPPMKYGQDYYTLRSIFFDGIAPPTIHMHLRMFDVATEVPIGDVLNSDANSLRTHTGGSEKRIVDDNVPETEREQFDLWLRELWQEKDESITRFFQRNSFNTSQQGIIAQIPVKLRSKREVLDAFCFFLPAAAVYLWGRVKG